MSNRDMSAAMLAEIAKGVVRTVDLIELQFVGGTEYFAMAWADIVWGGETYQATGDVVSVGAVNEDMDIKVGSIIISMSGVDQSNVSIALSEDYTDRPVSIYRAILDDTFSVIPEPILIFKGSMTSFSVREDPGSGESVLDWTVASHWADFEKKSGRLTNHESQQIHFPGDKGLEFASEIVKDLKWGRP